MHRRHVLLAGAALAVALAIPGVVAAQAREVKLGHLAPEGDPRHTALQHFAKAVHDGTGGAIKVNIYPNSTLGSERELVEQIRAGITEFALVGSVVSNSYPRWSVIDMPFLWADQAHLGRFMTSETARAWSDDMAQKLGLRLLSFFDRNPRILVTNRRPVRRVEDLKGLKVRVPEIATYIDTWRAFGVEPVPMAASEFYMGLRLGMIDGMENPVEVMHHWKIYEVGKYLSLTEHMQSGFFFLSGERFLSGLPADHRAVVTKAAAEAAAMNNELTRRGADELLDKLKAAGMEVVMPDKTGFQRASASVHEKYMDKFGRDVYERIKTLR